MDKEYVIFNLIMPNVTLAVDFGRPVGRSSCLTVLKSMQSSVETRISEYKCQYEGILGRDLHDICFPVFNVKITDFILGD